jgi:hypothetical protein
MAQPRVQARTSRRHVAGRASNRAAGVAMPAIRRGWRLAQAGEGALGVAAAVAALLPSLRSYARHQSGLLAAQDQITMSFAPA